MGIKGASESRAAPRVSRSRRIALRDEIVKALLGPFEGSRVAWIKPMPAVTGTVHDNLRGHDDNPCSSKPPLSLTSRNAQAPLKLQSRDSFRLRAILTAKSELDRRQSASRRRRRVYNRRAAEELWRSPRRSSSRNSAPLDGGYRSRRPQRSGDIEVMKRFGPFHSSDLLLATIAGLLAWIITIGLRAALGGQ
jgi:hypothetical protein